jgi:hypothetical protein
LVLEGGESQSTHVRSAHYTWIRRQAHLQRTGLLRPAIKPDTRPGRKLGC